MEIKYKKMIQFDLLRKGKTEMQKQIEKILGILIIMSVIPALAFADLSEPEVPFSLGMPEVQGSGCPDADSVTAVLSEDGDELTIMFNQFEAATTPDQPFDFSNCNVAVPIDVPAGMMVSLLGVDYRGLAFIPEGGMGRFSREYFFGGNKSRPVYTYIEEMGTFKEFLFEDSVLAGARSNCGDPVIARSNATLMVSRPYDSVEEAFMSMFSEDWTLNILFHLQWERCEEE